MYVKEIIKEAYYDRGLDIAMISFRGQSVGGKLVTPKFYNAMSVEDIGEPMEYAINKIKPKRSYAIGCSMGANILANYQGVY